MCALTKVVFAIAALYFLAISTVLWLLGHVA